MTEESQFERRRKAQAIATSLVFVALLGGALLAMAGMVQANRAAERERLAREEEARRRRNAQAVAAFVIDDFLAIPRVDGQTRLDGQGFHREATFGDLLDRAAEKLRNRSDLDPRSEAELCWIIGVSYRGVDEPAQGVLFLERAVELRREALGEYHPDTLDAMNCLAVCYGLAGRMTKAIELQEETLKRMKITHGPSHGSTVYVMNNLGDAYLIADRTEQAFPLLEEALALRKERLGADHPETLTSMNNLAMLYHRSGKIDQAVPLLQQVVALRTAKFGPDHDATLNSQLGLAIAHHELGQFEQAAAIFDETLALLRSQPNPDRSKTLTCLFRLGTVYCDSGQGKKAIPMFQEYVADLRQQFFESDPELASSLAQVGYSLLKGKQFVDAEAMLGEALLIREVIEPDAWKTFNTRSLLGAAFLGQSKLDDAEPLLVEAYEGLKAREQDIPPSIAQVFLPAALDRLIELYRATNRPEQTRNYEALRAHFPAANAH